MNNLHVRKNDTVIVLSGKEKGKTGKVLHTLPKDGKVVIEGLNVATVHQKPRRQTDPGGIVHKEIPMRACKVMRVCPKCDKPTRLGHAVLADGSRSRVCKKCGEHI